MRAAVIHEFGPIDRIEVEEIETRPPRRNEVSVKIEAAALNHLDIWVRKGRAQGPFPHILGSDATGVVQEVGDDVEGLRVGDAVVLYPALGCGFCSACGAGEISLCEDFRIVGAALPGTYAEQVCLPASSWHPRPPNLSVEGAAALPLTFLTAWRMVVSRGRVRPGETVVVTGIGGGVATAALQIALIAGARVIVTSSSDEKLARARDLGADAAINYRTTPDLVEAIRELTAGKGADVVIDSAGAAMLAPALSALRKGGRLVLCGVTSGPTAEADLRTIYYRQLEVIGSTLGSQRELGHVLNLASAGRLKPLIDRVYPLEQVREATARMEAGEQLGKIVLRL